MARKYKLLREKVQITRVLDGKSVMFEKLHRIQALRDIPRHGVKTGDLGGYVGHRKSLRHDGDCWVAKDAIVAEYSGIVDNALITDQAVVIGTDVSGNAVVRNHAFISDSVLSGEIIAKDNVEIKSSRIYGKAIIDKNSQICSSQIEGQETGAIVTDEVVIDSTTIVGKFLASGQVRITKANITGDTEVSGTSQILPNAKISGTSRINGDSFVPPAFEMANIVLHNQVAEYGLIQKSNMAPQQSAITGSVTPETESYIESIKELEEEYNSYVTDIVKLIKYPAMADLSIPETQSLSIALRAAKRAMKSPHVDRLKQAHENLEMAFVVAENRAHILVQSHLDDTKKASLLKADQLFAIACNEVSSETEKKASFKKGIQNLAGVIPVSEEAISVFKVKAGLLEIEA